MNKNYRSTIYGAKLGPTFKHWGESNGSAVQYRGALCAQGSCIRAFNQIELPKFDTRGMSFYPGYGELVLLRATAL
ncbi:hypothetical protein LZ554_000131 [Drepanopeziza brunnea f. sp. 'monogermtubi']|nr:hypothetical protein LZ554_000131 [Drepanopeziza brunnea f. sp. 'monogermtubi']